ncbi:MAG: hypothetical protein ACPGUY_07440, partial [Akkermansiaceae bacterium]
MNPSTSLIAAALISIAVPSLIAQTTAAVPSIPFSEGTLVFSIRDIPEGTPKKGHGKNAKKYGYRIPSLLVSKKGTILAFTERRLGLHDHA